MNAMNGMGHFFLLSFSIAAMFFLVVGVIGDITTYWKPKPHSKHRHPVNANEMLRKLYEVVDAEHPYCAELNVVRHKKIRKGFIVWVKIKPYKDSDTYTVKIVYKKNRTIRAYILTEDMGSKSVHLPPALIVKGYPYSEMRLVTVWDKTTYDENTLVHDVLPEITFWLKEQENWAVVEVLKDDYRYNMGDNANITSLCDKWGNHSRTP